MASSSDEGRLLLYMQQVKRENKVLLRKSEEIADSLSKIDSLYESMQKHEVKLKDVDRKFSVLAEDDSAMLQSFKKLSSDNRVRFEKIGAELQNFSGKTAHLEVFVKEHTNRFESNVPLLQSIQRRLDQLEDTVRTLSKGKGKVVKEPEQKKTDNIIQQLAFLRSLVEQQESNSQKLREELTEVKHGAQQLAKTVSQATGSENQGAGTFMPPSPTQEPVRSVRRSSMVQHVRSPRRQTLFPSRVSKNSIHPPISSMRGAENSTPALASTTKALQMMRSPRKAAATSSTRSRPTTQQSTVALRRSVRLSEKKNRLSPIQPDASLHTATQRISKRTSKKIPTTVQMNQSYPRIQAAQLSPDPIKAMEDHQGVQDGPSFRTPSRQRNAGTRTFGLQEVKQQNMEQRNNKPESSAEHMTPRNHATAPNAPLRRRKKRELPPRKPLPPYED